MPFSENRREKLLVLITMCFALFMAMLDNTVVNVALPTLSRELGAGVSGLQWIVDGYVLAFASLLLTGGILGDRYGRKRMFLAGVGAFTVASIMCGFSSTTGQLVGFRALQGTAAALLMPGTLSILTVTFPAEERAKAIGIWAGVSGLALSLGPTLGGWMVEHVGWESVFFLNGPIGFLGFLVALRVVRESREPEARQLDLVGLLLGTAGLFSLTYGLIEANERGWSDPLVMGSLAGGVLVLGAFVAWEVRTRAPMMPLGFFRIPAFSAGNAIAFSISLGMFGTFFFVSLFMQLVRGYTPFETGIRFVPMTAMIVLAAPNAGRFAQKHGSRWPMTIGLLLAASGLLMMSRVGTTTPYTRMMPNLMIMGLGMGSVMAPMTAAVMNAVGPARAGLGSAMTNTSREIGGVFGIALLGTLLTNHLRTTLAARLGGMGLGAAREAAILTAAGHARIEPATLQGLRPDQVLAVRGAFSDSFLSGFQLAQVVAAGFLTFAALVASRWIPAGAPQADGVAVEKPTAPVWEWHGGMDGALRQLAGGVAVWVPARRARRELTWETR